MAQRLHIRTIKTAAEISATNTCLAADIRSPLIPCP
ncbi:hypothetical protein PS732_02533 [Pseudomonas fluorescens]|uniref:Uncharacterized protein n=1 Tax=Pseudomonas fluorescens TaxID=294 RepID=A0ABD7VFF3_PSEFL|nr:hypothetical protein PS732_02533 [Pseudomonas fluorescens]